MDWKIVMHAFARMMGTQDCLLDKQPFRPHACILSLIQGTTKKLEARSAEWRQESKVVSAPLLLNLSRRYLTAELKYTHKL